MRFIYLKREGRNLVTIKLCCGPVDASHICDPILPLIHRGCLLAGATLLTLPVPFLCAASGPSG
jgi:hypothetical protein